MGSFAHVVGAKSASWRSGVCDAIRPYCKFAHIFNSPPFQIRPCYNSPPFQITHIANSPTFQICPHCKSPAFQICPIANYPCYDSPTCGRTNCNSPLHVCFLDVHKYACKYTKKHHRHGVSMFAYVVGAICKSPILQFTPIPNHPCYKSPPFQIRPCFQLPPFQIVLGIKNSKKVFYYKNKFVSLPP